jgi:hypothetical protein
MASQLQGECPEQAQRVEGRFIPEANTSPAKAAKAAYTNRTLIADGASSCRRKSVATRVQFTTFSRSRSHGGNRCPNLNVSVIAHESHW